MFISLPPNFSLHISFKLPSAILSPNSYHHWMKHLRKIEERKLWQITYQEENKIKGLWIMGSSSFSYKIHKDLKIRKTISYIQCELLVFIRSGTQQGMLSNNGYSEGEWAKSSISYGQDWATWRVAKTAQPARSGWPWLYGMKMKRKNFLSPYIQWKPRSK